MHQDSASDVAVTPLKGNKWQTDGVDELDDEDLLFTTGGGLLAQGYSGMSPNSLARSGGGQIPTPPSSTKKERPPAATTNVGDEEEDGDVDQGELDAQVKQLRLRGEATLERVEDRRGVVPYGRKTSATESALSSARAMAKKLNPGGAVTDAARMIALEEECRSLTIQSHTQEKGLINISNELEKAKKTILTMQQRWEKEHALNNELSNKLKLAESQLALSKKELAVLQRQVSKATTSQATKGGSESTTSQDSVRLQRALEEVEKLRKQLSDKENAEAAGNGRGADASDKNQMQHLITENKKLEAQRMELLMCIRKQNKLIDVLKRQKMHLEASRLLQITEEEFTKAMECNLNA